MSAYAASEDTFVRDYVKELNSRNAAVFVGAGLSVASGYVDWRSLLKDIFRDLQLDPTQESDLVAIAQYHCNKVGGKGKLTQIIFDHFAATKGPSENHKILARLPIETYWTTNYDKLIEEALKQQKRVPDVKYTLKQLASTRLDRDAIIYKMHGDVDHPADVIISRDDYEAYPVKMQAFVSALRGDLIERTFLFLGFSFTDPNLDYILSRVRVQYERDQRQHYCILRAVSKERDESDEQFQYRQRKQDYFIADLKRFAIQTVLVAEYVDVTRVLRRLLTLHQRRSIFISGAAHGYAPFADGEAKQFIHELAFRIAARRNRVVTGFGLGVGDAVINGVLAYLSDIDKTVSEDSLVMRPFPQTATGTTSLADQWTEYRRQIASMAGIAIFVFGNKLDAAGNVVLSNGMLEEFDRCVEAGVVPIPIGATHWQARELWLKVKGKFNEFFPDASAKLRDSFERLNDHTIGRQALQKEVTSILDELQGV